MIRIITVIIFTFLFFIILLFTFPEKKDNKILPDQNNNAKETVEFSLPDSDSNDENMEEIIDPQYPFIDL